MKGGERRSKQTYNLSFICIIREGIEVITLQEMEKGIVKILAKPPEIVQRDNKDMQSLKDGDTQHCELTFAKIIRLQVAVR